MNHDLHRSQIGPPVDLRSMESRLQSFLASRRGAIFGHNTLLALNGQSCRRISAVHAEVFQQGYFQFVARAAANGQEFCLIISKGTLQSLTDRVTVDEFHNLKYYHSLYPDLFVQPLVLCEKQGADPVLYSSRLYPDQLELDYQIDGRAGRHGLYLNSPKTPNGFCRPFDLADQDPLLEEMVKILAVAYDQKTGAAIEGFKVSAGDFIVNFIDRDHFAMRLIAARSITRQEVPIFVCSLVNYFLGLRGSPSTDQITHLGSLFNERTVFNGLAKAFVYKEGLTVDAAQRKASDWMRAYNVAGETGELDGYLARLEELKVRAGLSHLVRYYHRRADQR